MLAFALLTILAAPPIASPPQAVARLRAAKDAPSMVAAVKDVSAACRGKLRHSLRDHPALLGEAKKIATTRPNAERKAALDLFRCFSEKNMLQLLVPNLSGGDAEMVAYAAEVAARLEAPETVPPLLDVLANERDACLRPGLAKAEVEVCVWLAYAPGPGLSTADSALRKTAGEAVKPMLGAPYAKVREVAVETLAATRLKAYAPAVGELIASEKKGAFADKNDAALLARFADRKKALAKGE